MHKWHLLYATVNLPEAAIIKGMLQENLVPVILVNRQDSNYLNFGDIELYVPAHLKFLAAELLNSSLMN